MVISTFCSKCHYNRNLWKEVTENEIELIEINSAESKNNLFLERLEVTSTPTIFLMNEGNIIYRYDGVINSKIIKSMTVMANNL